MSLNGVKYSDTLRENTRLLVFTVEVYGSISNMIRIQKNNRSSWLEVCEVGRFIFNHLLFPIKKNVLLSPFIRTARSLGQVR